MKFEPLDYVQTSYWFDIPIDELKRVIVVDGQTYQGKRRFYALALEYCHQFNPYTVDIAEARWKEVQKRLADIDSMRAEIGGIYQKIYDSFPPTFKMFNYAEFDKACKKHKVTLNMVYNGIELTFRNIRIGDEISGYINYKSIIIFMSLDFKTVEARVFNFKGFHIETKWHLIPSPHPAFLEGLPILGGLLEDWLYAVQNHDYESMMSILRNIIYTVEDNLLRNTTTIASLRITLNKFSANYAEILKTLTAG